MLEMRRRPTSWSCLVLIAVCFESIISCPCPLPLLTKFLIILPVLLLRITTVATVGEISKFGDPLKCSPSLLQSYPRWLRILGKVNGNFWGTPGTSEVTRC